jgi:alpha,alpha-trehalase
LDHFDEVIRTLEGKTPVLFFDYDGTLTPIVDNPDEAILSAVGKQALERLSRELTVAVVSGRGLSDLKGKVGLASLIYAGSHGFEIAGPDGLEMELEEGQQILPQLDEAEKVLLEKLREVSGCIVERKKYAIAVHYRKVDEGQVGQVKKIVADVVERHDRLKIGVGKMILELKPAIDWHKGEAIKWLLKKLELRSEAYKHVFFGDDITDEDALKVVQQNGIGILVGMHGQETYANYRLEHTQDVYAFLEKLWGWYGCRGNE